jgi:phage shock protein C
MKELYKSNTDKMIFGVCGGIGEFFNVSGTAIRLLFVIFTLAGGSGIILYIIAAILMPSNNVYKNDNIYRNRD